MPRTMTSKERVKAAFAHNPVDRVPMMILLGETWMIEREKISFKDLREMDDLGAELIVRTYDEMQSDSVTTGLGCWIGLLEALGCPTEISKIGAPIEVKPCIHDVAADISSLDRSKIRERLENSELIQKMMRQSREIKKLVGDRKSVAGQMVGPFSGASMMVGVKEFMILLGKKSPYIKPLLEYATDCCAEIANMYCENGCDLIQTCDPCSSGDMISPKMYEQHVVPTLEGLTSQLKNCETFLLHICGKAGMRLPHVKALGIDGFSVDSSVDLKESLEAAGKELSMVGNFNPNELLCMGTSEAVYAAAYANAEIAGLDGGYVMMPGCDLAARTPLENILAMVRASSDYAASVRN